MQPIDNLLPEGIKSFLINYLCVDADPHEHLKGTEKG